MTQTAILSSLNYPLKKKESEENKDEKRLISTLFQVHV